MSMRIYDENGDTVAVFYSVKRKGDRLIVDGKALDVMRMDMILMPGEILGGFKMALCWDVFVFVSLLPCLGMMRLFKRVRK